ncbi:MAG: RNA polymerase sigma-B factor [Chroococcidiopsis cubana SAG 39.79]|uniref:RNA polymerase sigma factor SigF n=1 Tax=Chroococcidiopsis cubana SAG 39.79 TaxID=388085 RepID=A0AB37UQN1_9CYAN|nr:sigma-70 family RNA polymerase sigma factor [Chroococcidiopsis cubana]MDZ4872552.1 RNA polymerase sigma-B factor [Chroococcidiopsis cubana SAG 39.79]RUT13764.1 RNA polymerase sigma factor SigF [Chroococcidiopsis cubana SAG 39.79]
MVVTQTNVYCNEIELLISYYQKPSLWLRNRLVRRHAGLVRQMARQLYHRSPEPYEDLEQIGYFGLIRAIERFNPARGYAFSSFAIPYIRGEILHFIRDRAGVVKIPRRWQELHARGQKVYQQLTSSLGRLPTDLEIARSLHVSLSEWRESQLAIQNCRVFSLDSTLVRESDGQIQLADTIAERRSCTLQPEEERQQLRFAMNQLEENTRKAVELVFLQQFSRKKAAQYLGVSPMTVTRYLQKGKQQLFELLQP